MLKCLLYIWDLFGKSIPYFGWEMVGFTFDISYASKYQRQR